MKQKKSIFIFGIFICVLGIVLVVLLLFHLNPPQELSSYGGASSGARATPNKETVLNYIPSDVHSVFMLDFNKFMKTKIATLFLAEIENTWEYWLFKEVTGIDFAEVHYALNTAAYSKMTGAAQNATILCLQFNKATLLSIIKNGLEEEGLSLGRETYEGADVFNIEGDYENGFSLLDNSLILLGNKSLIKSILDVSYGKKANVYSNIRLSQLLSKTNKSLMFWGAMILPEELRDEVKSEDPLEELYSEVDSYNFHIDYVDEDYISEILLLSYDISKNEEIANLMNASLSFYKKKFARFFYMLEFLNNITITSQPDSVIISATVPENLILSVLSQLGDDFTTSDF